MDAAGNLFIADYYNDVVREVVKATGDIITVAGSGTPGYSGDGGPATSAELSYPESVAVDAAGNLFIADDNNQVVREVVKATGDILTVAGSGAYGSAGDGGPATAPRLEIQLVSRWTLPETFSLVTSPEAWCAPRRPRRSCRSTIRPPSW